MSNLPFFLFKVVFSLPTKPQKGQSLIAADYSILCENTKGSACLGGAVYTHAFESETLAKGCPPTCYQRAGQGCPVKRAGDAVCFCGLRSQFGTQLERASGWVSSGCLPVLPTTGLECQANTREEAVSLPLHKRPINALASPRPRG